MKFRKSLAKAKQVLTKLIHVEQASVHTVLSLEHAGLAKVKSTAISVEVYWVTANNPQHDLFANEEDLLHTRLG